MYILSDPVSLVLILALVYIGKSLRNEDLNKFIKLLSRSIKTQQSCSSFNYNTGVKMPYILLNNVVEYFPLKWKKGCYN